MTKIFLILIVAASSSIVLHGVLPKPSTAGRPAAAATGLTNGASSTAPAACDYYKDAAQGYRSWAIAAEADALNEFGEMYENGCGVSQDYYVAAEFYWQSARLHNSVAQCNLGRLAEEGKGMSVDVAQAATWYMKAAEQGNCEAQYRLGLMYEQGTGVHENRAQARNWYKQAVEKGHRGALERLELLQPGDEDSPEF